MLANVRIMQNFYKVKFFCYNKICKVSGGFGRALVKKIAICDDVEVERFVLKRQLMAYFRSTGEEADIQEFVSGESLLADIEEDYIWPDLIFLDIYMGALNGMETARRLRSMNVKAPIVFLTASPDFALESYEVEASGYLLKPAEEEQTNTLLRRLLKTDLRKRIAVKCKRQFRYPFIDDMLYLESDRHTVTIHMLDGSKLVTADKLGELEKKIGDDRFLRCHQSYLVNMEHIVDVDDGFVLRDRTTVPIRVRGRKEVVDQYNRFFMETAGIVGGGKRWMV